MPEKVLILGDILLESVCEEHLTDDGILPTMASEEWKHGNYTTKEKKAWGNHLDEKFIELLLGKDNFDAAVVCYLPSRVETLRNLGYTGRIVAIENGPPTKGADAQLAYTPSITLGKRLREALSEHSGAAK